MNKRTMLAVSAAQLTVDIVQRMAELEPKPSLGTCVCMRILRRIQRKILVKSVVAVIVAVVSGGAGRTGRS